MTDVDDLVDDLLAGDERALARTISIVEDREPGHRQVLSALYRHPGEAIVVGVTGSPGVGKSTLVDALVRAYRERGETVGVIAVDPSSPFTGGALLGDRVRMDAAAGDDGVFVRSMSARGSPGGIAATTLDAVRALSAAGRDVVIVETVGTGQNEVAIVGTADTVVVVSQPGSGDDVQAMKAGLLEIGDVYVVNKADLPGADRAVRDLREMIDGAIGGLGSHRVGPDPPDAVWTPPVVETIATEGAGLEPLTDAIDDHLAFLEDAGLRRRKARLRVAEAVRTHLAAAIETAVDRRIDAAGGLDGLVDAVLAGEGDPYELAANLVSPDSGIDHEGLASDADATSTSRE